MCEDEDEDPEDWEREEYLALPLCEGGCGGVSSSPPSPSHGPYPPSVGMHVKCAASPPGLPRVS